jgi:CheY-like chemotaxis protein
MVEFGPADRVVRYLCPGCEVIVPIDLAMDEIQTSSSCGHFAAVDRRKRVLVADTSPATRAVVADLLTEAGLEVIEAGDGEEALRLIRDEHPDLVVLDLLMPGKTGFEVLREVRTDARVRRTPVLAMSQVYKETIVGFLQEVGAQGFVDKDHIRSSLVFRVLRLLTPPPAVA